MARLVKTQTEWEGGVHEEFSIVEGEVPPPWPSDAKLKRIGKGEPRIDGPERVTGRARYTFDLYLPGMLFAGVLRSPYPHARIKRIDTDRASALPGVRSILSYLNAPKIPWWNDTVILEPVVRFAGDEVAVVAADTEHIAEDALGLIRVDYEELPFVIDPEEALRPDAPKVHDGGNLVDGKPRLYRRGDLQKGLAEADIIVEETFRTQSALHNCLESHGAVASWNGEELTVWESTQAIYSVREDLAQAFNLPLNKVRVLCEYMGGGFGSKQYTGKWSILAALLARQTGKPVHLMLNRHEENLATGNRAPTIQHLKIGAKRDGTLTAIDLVCTSGIGAYGWSQLYVEGPAQVMYACPNVRTEVRSVFTNIGHARSFRGPGYVEGMFPLESLIDELAAGLGMDPLELRLKNYVRMDQPSGKPYSDKNLDECYRRGAEMIGWTRQEVNRVNGSKRRAIGMASQIWGGGGGPPAYAWVRLNSDGTAEVMTGSQEIGTGTKTVFAQIAAEELGLGPEWITVHVGDTARGPYDPVSWGSMTVSSVGPAIRQAAIDAHHQLRQITADLLDVPSNQIEIRDGNVYVRDDSKPRMKLSDLSQEIGDFTILGKGCREPNQTEASVRTFGAQFAEVEVDTATGEVKVLRVVSAHDFGRVMNPLGSRSQVEGGVIQGIGYALTEGRIVDQRTGIVLNANLEDYLVPTILDPGEIEYAFIDKPDPIANSIGAKGLGEPALIPTAPAIANAIRRGIGVRFLSIPITREKILAGIRLTEGSRRVIP
jgi:xanthine dehydrogenase YagR molybdenum-binding subunit